MYQRGTLAQFILKYLTKITLPKSFANRLGNVFVPNVGNPPAWHRGLQGPLGPEPTKESKRESWGWAQSPQRVRPGVRKESKNAASDYSWTFFGLPGALFGGSGAPRSRRTRDTLLDSFRALLGFLARRAWETSLCPTLMVLSGVLLFRQVNQVGIKVRKIRAPIKIKSALPPPPPKPKISPP